MSARVGIPRALGYYYLYPFFKTLLETLGARVLVSPGTTKATLDRMDLCPTDEPCVAVKLYFAHVDKLLGMGADFVFMPVLVSMEKGNYCCPKFLGIADMVRNGLELRGVRVLAPRIDYGQRNRADIERPLIEMASELGVTDPKTVRAAISEAERVQSELEQLMFSEHLTVPEAFRMLDHDRIPEPQHTRIDPDSMPPSTLNPQPSTAVIGHPYMLYDMLSHDLVARVGEYGSVVTAEMVSRQAARDEVAGIHEGERMWSFEAHMLGAALHLLRERSVDRIILVGSFECGPESIIESYIEGEAARQGIPFLLLTIDEQTGEAGLITRVEAFMDTASGPRRSHQTPDPNPSITVPTQRSGMVVGLPSMGFLDIAVRAMLEDCGVQCIRTPKSSRKSMELGAQLAPEFVCFPLTVTLGQMRQMLDAGVNTIFMVGGKGQCRLGWYAQVQENLLRRAGYEFEMVILDSPVPLRTNWKPFRDTLKHITGGASWNRIIRAFRFAYLKLDLLDRAEAVCHRIRAVERDRGAVDTLFDSFVRRIDRASDMGTAKRLFRDFEEGASSLEVEETNPLRVRIVGEIWVVLEHFVNQEIEKVLASMDGVRVEVDRELSASHWFRMNVLSDRTLLARAEEIRTAALPYLSEDVGGHGQPSVGETVLARQEGCDGVIHIFPFTCMPEIVAQNILVNVSQALDIPVLTFIVSEQTGEAGIRTRVEAFLDVLQERRQRGRCVSV